MIPPAAPTPSPRTGPLRNGNPRGNPNLAPRCGARTRAGCPCRAPAMANGRCRMHGGPSTGPRTAEGRARAAAARTTHGDFTAAARTQERYLRALVARIRLLSAATLLRLWLAPPLRARLESGASELGALADPALTAERNSSPCNVRRDGRDARGRFAARVAPVTSARAAELAERQAEAARLAPWRAGIAAARAARRQAKERQQQAMHRDTVATSGAGPTHACETGVDAVARPRHDAKEAPAGVATANPRQQPIQPETAPPRARPEPPDRRAVAQPAAAKPQQLPMHRETVRALALCRQAGDCFGPPGLAMTAGAASSRFHGKLPIQRETVATPCDTGSRPAPERGPAAAPPFPTKPQQEAMHRETVSAEAVWRDAIAPALPLPSPRRALLAGTQLGSGAARVERAGGWAVLGAAALAREAGQDWRAAARAAARQAAGAAVTPATPARSHS
jgi:hypothetical protein